MVVRMPMVGAMGTWITPGAPNYASLEHSRSSRSRMNDPPRRYHYAFALHKVRSGWRVEHVIAFSRHGEDIRQGVAHGWGCGRQGSAFVHLSCLH
jgi:hypothetical protein